MTTRSTGTKSCVGCGSTTRKLPHPGPRCGQCHREVKRQRSERAHAARIEAVYGITAEQYAALYEAQGRVCALCMRATGKTKRLAVDHNHSTGEVRGLLCATDNQILGHARDDPAYFARAGFYLLDPPARKVLGS